jgi:hypothetical protein
MAVRSPLQYKQEFYFTAPSCPVGSPAKYRGLTQLLGCIVGSRVNIGVHTYRQGSLGEGVLSIHDFKGA